MKLMIKSLDIFSTCGKQRRYLKEPDRKIRFIGSYDAVGGREKDLCIGFSPCIRSTESLEIVYRVQLPISQRGVGLTRKILTVIEEFNEKRWRKKMR